MDRGTGRPQQEAAKQIMNDRVEEELRRAPAGTREALQAFKQNGKIEDLEAFVRGIIGRNIDDEFLEVLENAEPSTRFIEDLGIDSLTMVEIAMTLEEALDVELLDEDLQELATLREMRNYLQKKTAEQRAPPPDSA